MGRKRQLDVALPIVPARWVAAAGFARCREPQGRLVSSHSGSVAGTAEIVELGVYWIEEAIVRGVSLTVE
jgi:hypothetical protein